LGAEAVEDDFVRFGDEAGGEFGFNGDGAAGDFEDALAVAAGEMVVVLFAGDFVAGGLAGKFNRGEPAFFEEGFDVAVNGGDADALDVGLGKFEDLKGPERAADAFKDFADGRLLAGVALGYGFFFGNGVRVRHGELVLDYLYC
jgi:hypothetical protein